MNQRSENPATETDERELFARKIGWRESYERHLPTTIAREAHLRTLMGLPPQPPAVIDAGDAE
jgi:hypothetical protein